MALPTHLSETQHCVSVFPAGLLEPHLALPNRVLVRGPDGVLVPPRHTAGLPEAAQVFVVFKLRVSQLSEDLSVRAFLRCDFALRSDASGCSCAHFPPGLRHDRAGPFSRRLAEPFCGVRTTHMGSCF